MKGIKLSTQFQHIVATLCLFFIFRKVIKIFIINANMNSYAHVTGKFAITC